MPRLKSHWFREVGHNNGHEGVYLHEILLMSYFLGGLVTVYVYHMQVCPSPGRWLNTDTMCFLAFFFPFLGFRSHHCSKTVSHAGSELCHTSSVGWGRGTETDREKAGETARYHLTVLGSGNGVLWKMRL